MQKDMQKKYKNPNQAAIVNTYLQQKLVNPFPKEETSNQNSRGNTIHPLSRQLQTNSKQLPRNPRLILLQRLPPLITQTPRHTVMLGLHSRRTPRVTKERQFTARPASNDKLKVPALREIVFCAQHAGFEEIEGAWDVAFVIQDCSGGVGLAGEVCAGGEPEVFVLGGEALEGLEEEGEGLAH
jgi:hypothetical protein